MFESGLNRRTVRIPPSADVEVVNVTVAVVNGCGYLMDSDDHLKRAVDMLLNTSSV